MNIERAKLEDAKEIEKLLYEVHDIHASARPDLFVKGSKKYTIDEIEALISSENRPVYVYRIDCKIVAHTFVEYTTPTAPSLRAVKTMYIDDICVDSQYLRQGLGSVIMTDLENIARENDCYRILLNVYNFNTSALDFYTKMGLAPLSTHMEKIL